MRRGWKFPSACLVLVLIVAGCGGSFKMPTEHPTAVVVPTPGTYHMVQTWKGLNFVQAAMISGDQQLYMLFNDYPLNSPSPGLPTYNGGYGPPTTPYGAVAVFQFKKEAVVDGALSPLQTLFNPVALAYGQHLLFVLDQGDSCEAKFDVVRGTCEADKRSVTTDTLQRPRPNVIRDYRATWRVREYHYDGGDTISTFTDTTYARVYGVAADDNGYVYVSGIATEISRADPSNPVRQFTSKISRYVRGPRYPGVTPSDVNMPGCNWHRDTTWTCDYGFGSGYVSDPRQIAIAHTGMPGLFVASHGDKTGKLISTDQPNSGSLILYGNEVLNSQNLSGPPFTSPEGAATDPSGGLFVVDRGSQRVLRYDGSGNLMQIVNAEPNSDKLPLLDPVGLGVNDSLAYVVDRGRAQVIVYQRRQ